MSKESRVTKPQQDRSRESLERVLEAGREILMEDGWHGLTLARVCERAGVTVGMLYRRFHGREELLQALKNEWIDDAIAAAEALHTRSFEWQNMEPRAALKLAIGMFTEGFRTNEAQTRMFSLHSVLDNEELQHLQKVSLAYAQWYHGILRQHIGAITHPNPEKAIDFSYRIMLDTMVRRATHGDDFSTGRPLGDWDEFEHELFTVCAGYLFRAQPEAALEAFPAPGKVRHASKKLPAKM